MRQSIFDKYVRLEGRRNGAKPTGYGLGLAFCRLAVEAHGGRITVGGNEPRGSMFTIRLPPERSA